MKVDLSKRNPFAGYRSNFARNFSFGDGFDKWVSATMLPALMGDTEVSASVTMADLGAGSCYWAAQFLQELPNAVIVAVDPSEDLLQRQAPDVISALPGVADRITRRQQTAQEFAETCGSEIANYDTIFFMQSAHYIAHEEFDTVFRKLAVALKPERGRIVIQARNMTPEWHPWAFPEDWREQVQGALIATDMFNRADRYLHALKAMSDVFSDVSIFEASTEVHVACEDYWKRLEDRWIPTFISEDIVSPELHAQGIANMKRDYRGRDTVSWIEKFAVVSAHV